MSLSRGPVTLRSWDSGDVDIFHRLVADAQESLRPWMSWAIDEYTREDAAAFIVRSAENRAAGEVYSYGIFVAGAPVGTAGMERNEYPDVLEIGYWLHPAHTRRGLATAAATALVRQAFALADIDRVEIVHDAANTTSGDVPWRLGFTEVERRNRSGDPLLSGEVGIEVVWRLTRT